MITFIKTGNEVVTSWDPWEVHNVGENPPGLRNSLQPNLTAEAFRWCLLLFRFWRQSSPAAWGRGHISCLWQKSSEQEAATAKCIWHLLTVNFNSFLWLFYCCWSCSHVFADEKSAHLWVQVLGNLLTWTWGSSQVGWMAWCSDTVPIWGMNLQFNWNNRVYVFVHSLISVLPGLFFILYPLILCSFFWTWNTLLCCFCF